MNKRHCYSAMYWISYRPTVPFVSKLTLFSKIILGCSLQPRIILENSVSLLAVHLQWSMLGFHYLVAIPSLTFAPFCFAIPLCRCDVALHRCRSSVLYQPLPLYVRTELLEKSFRIRRDEMTWMLLSCPAVQLFDPICYKTAITVEQQLERQRHHVIFHVGPRLEIVTDLLSPTVCEIFGLKWYDLMTS